MHDVNGIAESQTGTGIVEFSVITTIVAMAAAVMFKHDSFHVTQFLQNLSHVYPG